MFTGIIETLGRVEALHTDRTNVIFEISASITPELKVDQSIAHNGVCLTVTGIEGSTYRVTAIDETLQKTSLGLLRQGEFVNLERCMPANGRFDGHFVQGHVDQVGTCTEAADQKGSWLYTFEYDTAPGNFTVEKGSICVNGVSLTVVNSAEGKFSVAIIPYTYEHTNFRTLRPGQRVNLEFDVLGKYLKKIAMMQRPFAEDRR